MRPQDLIVIAVNSGSHQHSAFRGTIFSLTLIIVTILPAISIMVVPMYPSMGPRVVDFLVVLSSTHVFATLYLFTDPAIRLFVLRHPIKMILIPLVLILASILAFSSPEYPAFVAILLLFFLYQTWHFGAQNIGVATYVSLAERGRGLAPTEKITIRLGILCGMLGVLRALYPDFMIGKQYMPLDPVTLRVFDFLREIGSIAALVLSVLAAVFLLKAWRQQNFLYGIAIFFSITFLFPMYLSENYMIGFGSFAVAHGLQYLVFLSTHSLGTRISYGNTPNIRFSFLFPPVILVATIFLGYLIWSKGPEIKSEHFTLFGMSIILGLTLAHFWIDQFLWKMKDRERAQWVKDRYRFLFRQ
ncbi:MAG: hypothetical protein HY080_15390 [Gammaproteobacteria bacterium]|nr:hypothetical protein [Gammaproteobacteria bacterium]